MELPNQKEQFSIAYVRAVVSVAGFVVSRQEVDEDSVDMTLSARGVSGTYRSPKLDLQLSRDFEYGIRHRTYSEIQPLHSSPTQKHDADDRGWRKAMKASIQERDALCSLLPLNAATYLRTRGWNEVKREQQRYSLWNRQDDRGIFEALLPLEHKFRDYTVRIAEMLSTLEVVEERSQLEILRDMMTTSSDVIRIRTERDSKEDSVPIERGIALVKNARDLLLAAACSTVAPRAYYPTRKPDEALKYLENLRMGQTERGSYVLTLLSPVTPDLQASEYSDNADPFERKVTKTLMRAMAALREAAEESASTGTITPFETAISLGVSVNLCDALANLQEETRADTLEVGISWAPVRAVHERTIQNRVTFTKDAVPVMREASRVFKSVATQEGVSLRGFITELHREPQGEGTILIAGVVEGALRNVRVTLASPDYDRAIQAHRDTIPVRCEGDLVREGRGYRLQNPRGFAVEVSAD